VFPTAHPRQGLLTSAIARHKLQPPNSKKKALRRQRKGRQVKMVTCSTLPAPSRKGGRCLVRHVPERVRHPTARICHRGAWN